MRLAKAEAIYRPNILINGDFQVWQRGESITLSNVSETGYKYLADRWCRYFSSTSSASETYEKVSNGMKYTSTTQPNATITQLLETGLKSGNKYTLSASVNDIIHVMTFDGQVDKSEGILSYIKGVSTIPYDRIIFSVSNNDIVNWVKLEVGSIATPLIPRLIAEELALCERYTLKIPNSYNAYTGSGGKIYIVYQKLMNMRTNPSVIALPSSTNIVINNGTVNFDIESILCNKETGEIIVNVNNPTSKKKKKTIGGWFTNSVILDAEIK